MEFICNTPAKQAFMELVRCGIAGAAPRQGLFRGLSGADWETIYTLARRQTVCGICYDAYCKLPDSLLPGGTLLPRWVARVNAIETSNRAMGIAVDLVQLWNKCEPGADDRDGPSVLWTDRADPRIPE